MRIRELREFFAFSVRGFFPQHHSLFEDIVHSIIFLGCFAILFFPMPQELPNILIRIMALLVIVMRCFFAGVFAEKEFIDSLIEQHEHEKSLKEWEVRNAHPDDFVLHDKPENAKNEKSEEKVKNKRNTKLSK